jgi:hypothetical protein
MSFPIVILFFLYAFTTLSAESLELYLPHEEPEQNISHKEQFIMWLHNRNSPKDLGLDDPHLPAFLQYKPTHIELPNDYKVPEDFIVINKYLDLRSMRPQRLQNLSSDNLKNLLNYLASIEIKIKYTNTKGKIQSGSKTKLKKHHWEKSNAACALALNMAMQSQSELFVKIVALAPESILSSMHGSLIGLINPLIMADIIGTMLISLEIGTSATTAKHIGNLLQESLVYWVAKDVRKINNYLGTLLSHTIKIIENAGGPFKNQRLGILLGSLLAGTIKHSEGIKSTDEKRIWVIGVVSNFAWAATTFIGAAPIAAPFVAASAGGLSIGAVLSTTILSALDYPRNYTPGIKEIEGNLEMAALELAHSGDTKNKLDTLIMLKYMQAAIHINGLAD